MSNKTWNLLFTYSFLYITICACIVFPINCDLIVRRYQLPLYIQCPVLCIVDYVIDMMMVKLIYCMRVCSEFNSKQSIFQHVCLRIFIFDNILNGDVIRNDQLLKNVDHMLCVVC